MYKPLVRPPSLLMMLISTAWQTRGLSDSYEGMSQVELLLLQLGISQGHDILRVLMCCYHAHFFSSWFTHASLCFFCDVIIKEPCMRVGRCSR